MRTLLIGTFNDGGRMDAAVMQLESAIGGRELREKLRQLALEYLVEMARDEGRAIDYSYNFGDVVELLDEPGFEAKMASAGIRRVPLGDVEIDVSAHDDIWADQYEVNSHLA